MRELFVYYRVPAAQTGAARSVVLEFQAELSLRHPALMARLLRRDENVIQGIDGNSEQTWMETYVIDARTHAGGVSAALQAEIEAAACALAPFIDGTRHTEVFIACAWP